jgi:quercetin dioxygenase-like cupin family protein
VTNDPIRDLSFRAQRGDAFSSLSLLRKFGLRREKSLFGFVSFVTALGWRRFRVKSLLYAPMVLLVLSLNAQAPEPARLPGEPHHHLKIENEYVRAYYVEVAPHESTQLHRHDHDYIFVSLGPADVVNAVPDKPEVHLLLKDGETHFTRGGFAHIARNLSDAPFRNVTIELLHPQGEAHNECGFVIPGQGAAVCDPPPGADWAHTQFETAEARLDHVWLSSKGKDKEKASKFSFLVLGLSGSEIKINTKGKSRKTLREGEMEWFDAGSEVQFSSYEDTKTAQFLKLTFKDSAVHANP